MSKLTEHQRKILRSKGPLRFFNAFNPCRICPILTKAFFEDNTYEAPVRFEYRGLDAVFYDEIRP